MYMFRGMQPSLSASLCVCAQTLSFLHVRDKARLTVSENSEERRNHFRFLSAYLEGKVIVC